MSDDLLLFRFVETLLPSENVRASRYSPGPRQTGKTTSAQKVPRRYIDLVTRKPGRIEIIINFRVGKAVGPAVLDEAQKRPVVFEVKYAFDSQALSFSVMLGSADSSFEKCGNHWQDDPQFSSMAAYDERNSYNTGHC